MDVATLPLYWGTTLQEGGGLEQNILEMARSLCNLKVHVIRFLPIGISIASIPLASSHHVHIVQKTS